MRLAARRCRSNSGGHRRRHRDGRQRLQMRGNARKSSPRGVGARLAIGRGCGPESTDHPGPLLNQACNVGHFGTVGDDDRDAEPRHDVTAPLHKSFGVGAGDARRRSQRHPPDVGVLAHRTFVPKGSLSAAIRSRTAWALSPLSLTGKPVVDDGQYSSPSGTDPPCTPVAAPAGIHGADGEHEARLVRGALNGERTVMPPVASPNPDHGHRMRRARRVERADCVRFPQRV